MTGFCEKNSLMSKPLYKIQLKQSTKTTVLTRHIHVPWAARAAELPYNI